MMIDGIPNRPLYFLPKGHYWVMWVKQYHKPLGTGKHTTKQKMVNLAGWFMALFYPRENV